jgi:hypothetical protein
MNSTDAPAPFRSADAGGRHRSRTRTAVVIGALVGFTLAARHLGYKLGPNTTARCRQGHVFMTILIPGVNLKAIDLGIARLQRCPVGSHWSLVTPVRDSDLTNKERQLARQHRDVRIP